MHNSVYAQFELPGACLANGDVKQDSVQVPWPFEILERCALKIMSTIEGKRFVERF